MHNIIQVFHSLCFLDAIDSQLLENEKRCRLGRVHLGLGTGGVKM